MSGNDINNNDVSESAQQQALELGSVSDSSSQSFPTDDSSSESDADPPYRLPVCARRDWECVQCGNLNLSVRTTCLQCNTQWDPLLGDHNAYYHDDSDYSSTSASDEESNDSQSDVFRGRPDNRANVGRGHIADQSIPLPRHQDTFNHTLNMLASNMSTLTSAVHHMVQRQPSQVISPLQSPAPIVNVVNQAPTTVKDTFFPKFETTDIDSNRQTMRDLLLYLHTCFKKLEGSTDTYRSPNAYVASLLRAFNLQHISHTCPTLAQVCQDYLSEASTSVRNNSHQEFHPSRLNWFNVLTERLIKSFWNDICSEDTKAKYNQSIGFFLTESILSKLSLFTSRSRNPSKEEILRFLSIRNNDALELWRVTTWLKTDVFHDSASERVTLSYVTRFHIIKLVRDSFKHVANIFLLFQSELTRGTLDTDDDSIQKIIRAIRDTVGAINQEFVYLPGKNSSSSTTHISSHRQSNTTREGRPDRHQRRDKTNRSRSRSPYVRLSTRDRDGPHSDRSSRRDRHRYRSPSPRRYDYSRGRPNTDHSRSQYKRNYADMDNNRGYPAGSSQRYDVNPHDLQLQWPTPPGVPGPMSMSSRAFIPHGSMGSPHPRNDSRPAGTKKICGKFFGFMGPANGCDRDAECAFLHQSINVQQDPASKCNRVECSQRPAHTDPECLQGKCYKCLSLNHIASDCPIVQPRPRAYHGNSVFRSAHHHQGQG